MIYTATIAAVARPVAGTTDIVITDVSPPIEHEDGIWEEETISLGDDHPARAALPDDLSVWIGRRIEVDAEFSTVSFPAITALKLAEAK